MAKDDYHVIVYQILAYLYTKLKAGEPVDEAYLKHDSPYLGINEVYWTYIIENLVKSGLIENVTVKYAWGNQAIIGDMSNARITPKGIEFLCDNSFLNKAKETLKDIKAIVPFI